MGGAGVANFHLVQQKLNVQTTHLENFLKTVYNSLLFAPTAVVTSARIVSLQVKKDKAWGNSGSSVIVYLQRLNVH